MCIYTQTLETIEVARLELDDAYICSGGMDDEDADDDAEEEEEEVCLIEFSRTL